MLFQSPLPQRRLIARLRDVRRLPPTAYAVAVASVAVAALARWALGDQLLTGLPFATFFLAILVATLVGGLWPGVVALVLSAVTAWGLFVPPAGSFPVDGQVVVSLGLFVLVGGLNVALIATLNAMTDRALTQERDGLAIIESAPNGIIVVDPRGVIQLANRSFARVVGYRRRELIGQKLEVLVPARFAGVHEKLRRSYLDDPRTRAMGAGRDLYCRHRDGREVPVEIGLTPLRRGAETWAVAIVIDITGRKAAEDRQRLLMRELQHRTRNVFAVVQSIASMTLSNNKATDGARADLLSRLRALANAYAIGAETPDGASLNDIIGHGLKGFSSRIRASGCEIRLNPKAAQDFALIVHELATNAVKHGALSAVQGKVRIKGTIEPRDDLFVFRWQESGGPAVCAPERRGFGSRLLLDSMQSASRGVTLAYPPEGLRYELRLPLADITSSEKGDPPPATEDGPRPEG